MRLWDWRLIPYLPNKQLHGQWSELNFIFKNKPNHILINYVYGYDKEELYLYSFKVESEMMKRRIHFKYSEYYYAYFSELENKGLYRRIMCGYEPFIAHHNKKYLLICFMNLYEKYLRGQKDFTEECFNKLYNYVNQYFDLKGLGIEK